jgi:hypothetical protein
MQTKWGASVVLCFFKFAARKTSATIAAVFLPDTLDFTDPRDQVNMRLANFFNIFFGSAETAKNAFFLRDSGKTRGIGAP